MKGKLLIILTGVALLHLFLLGGMALTGGCSSDDEQPINDQNYVPAPADANGGASAAVAPVLGAQPTTTAITPAPGIDLTPAPAPVHNFGPSSATKAETVKYTVQAGDSPWKIAKKYGVGVEELLSYNQISSAKSLKKGQILSIPPGGKLYEGSEKTSAIGKKPAPAVKKPASAVKAEKPVKKTEETHAVSGNGETYAVQKGDTLDKIAHKHHVKAADIASASGISIDKMLQIGQKLTIPKASATAPKGEKAADAAKDAKKPSVKGEKVDAKGEKTEKTEVKDAVKSGSKDPLLDDIPSPDAAPAGADVSIKPVASADAVKSAAATPEKASGYTADIDQDTTVDKLATQYGYKAEEIKKLNPDLPADGKVKAGSVVKLP